MKLYILCLASIINISFVSSNKILPTKLNQDNYQYYQKFLIDNKISPIPTPNKLKIYNIKPIIKNESQNDTQKVENNKEKNNKEENNKEENIKIQKTSKINMILFILFEICIISILLLVCFQNANKILYKEKEKEKAKDYSLPIYIRKNQDNNQNENCYRRISSHENLYSVA